MKYYIAYLLVLWLIPALGQQHKHDILTFTPPAGWKETKLENTIGFSTTDNAKGTWAQISIITSTASKGSIESDFESEWNELAVKPYTVSAKPTEIEKQVFNGWDLWTGLGQFTFNNQKANLLLSTFSNSQRCISFIIMSNTTQFGPAFDKFTESIQITPAGNPPTTTVGEVQPATQVPDPKMEVTPPLADGFKFNTTNFDDGWTSMVKEDWVEATKGNIKVLLHYPRKEDSEYISQQVDKTRLFWNLLVAPRYVNPTEFFLYEYNNDFEPGHFASAYLVDKDGKRQFVALFSKGKSGWIEVITPEKATFINNFGVDHPDSWFGNWEPLFNLSRLNRFAVAGSDLPGKWSSDFSGSQQYYSSTTGLYVGYTANSGRTVFVFHSNGTYDWDIGTANTVNGQTQVQTAKSSGTYTMKGNWQIACSKIENRAKTYDAYFSCIKGGRILWLQDVDYGGYTAFGKASK